MFKKLWIPFFVLTGAIAVAATSGCGSSSPAKTGTAGTTGHAGTTGTAGTGAAGTGTAGTGAAGTGTAGTGTAGTGTAGTGTAGTGTDGGTDALPLGKEVVYANAGTSLYVFDFNPADGTLTLKPTLTTVLPQVPQYAAIDSPAQKYMYVPATIEPANYVYSFSIDPVAGGLKLIAPPTADGGATDGGASDAAADGGASDAPAATGVVSPNGRAIFASLSKDNKYLLAVHNVTKAYTVFNLGTDGTVGSVVPQAGGADVNVGAFVHQIRVDPSGQYVIICDRGTDPTTTKDADGGVVPVAEGLGHLRTFGFANGVLTPIQTIAFPTGYGPRHVDFHPTKPWVYVSVGRGNLLNTYSFANGMLTAIDSKTSLASATEAAKFPPFVQDSVNGQQASGIMVHPSGKWLWISNTNRQVVPYTPDAGAGDAGSDAGSDAAPAPVAQVYNGTGVNNIAVFSIAQDTGIPTFVAATDAHGFVPRTFALDPSGRYVLAGNQKKVDTLVGSTVTTVQANVAVFSVAAADGKLTFVKAYDLTTGDVFWVGGRTVTGP